MVLAHHAVAYFAPGRLPDVATGGCLGVDLFFVLSGLLITTLLLEEHDRTGRLDLRRFAARRAARLLPALVLVLLTWTVVRWLGSEQPLPELLRVDAIVLTYSTNWFVVAEVDTGMGLGQMWSLAVEGQFYVVWPLLVLLALRARWRLRTQVAVLVAGIALSAGTRAALYHLSDGRWQDVYFRTDARADALLVGALAAVLWRHGIVSSRRLRPLVPLAVGLLLAAGQWADAADPWLYRGGFTVVALVCAVAVLGALEISGGVLGSRLAVAVGRTSYGTYLWHIPVYTALEFGPVELRFEVDVVVGLLVTGLLAAVSWRFLEAPLLQRWSGRTAQLLTR